MEGFVVFLFVSKFVQVGDRVIAPLPTGKTAVAKIDNFTAAGYAITFICMFLILYLFSHNTKFFI